MKRRAFLNGIAAFPLASALGLPLATPARAEAAAAIAVAKFMISIISLASKGRNPSDAIIIETYKSVKELHNRVSGIEEHLLSISAAIAELPGDVEKRVKRLLEQQVEKEVLALGAEYVSTIELFAKRREETPDLALADEEAERLSDIYKRIEHARNKLLLQSDYSIPTIIQAAAFEFSILHKLGADDIKTAHVADLYKARFAEALDSSQPASIASIGAKLEDDLSKTTNQLAGILRNKNLASDESDWMCHTYGVYDAYKGPTGYFFQSVTLPAVLQKELFTRPDKVEEYGWKEKRKFIPIVTVDRDHVFERETIATHYGSFQKVWLQHPVSEITSGGKEGCATHISHIEDYEKPHNVNRDKWLVSLNARNQLIDIIVMHHQLRLGAETALAGWA